MSGIMYNPLENNRDRDVCKNACDRFKTFIDENKPNPPALQTVPVFGVTLKNVPHDITVSELLKRLKSDFPEYFDHLDVLCTKYTNSVFDDGARRTIAVLSRVRGNIRDLQRKSYSKKLYFRNRIFTYVFLPDFGCPRAEDGKRMNPLNGSAYFNTREREGPKLRRGICLFSRTFRQSLPDSLLNQSGNSALFIRHYCFNEKDLPSEGVYHLHYPKRSMRRVETASELEAMQLIRLLSNFSLKQQNIQFYSKDNKTVSQCQDRAGLGVNGSLLKFDEYTHTIPLSWIDPAIKNLDFIDSFQLDCFRCQSPYFLVATSVNLEYLLAECACEGKCLSYDRWNSEPVPIDAPYHFPGEEYTRLTYLTRAGDESRLKAIPFLPKMTNKYATVQLMCNILLPILEQEWMAIRDESHKNFCEAQVSNFEEIVKLDSSKTLIILHVKVSQTKFWCSHKSTGFKNVTISCFVKMELNEHQLPVTFNGDLLVATKENDGCLLLRYEVEWNTNCVLEGGVVYLTPNADEQEYMYNRKYLSFLPSLYVEKDYPNYMVTRLFLENSTIRSAKSHHLSDYPLAVAKLIAQLNTQQNAAFIKAMTSPFSIIQGPPGTGKSHLVSVVALALSQTRSGVVLCTAASNIACNVMYRKITKLASDASIQVSVCRVFSRGRELQLRRYSSDHEDSLADSKSDVPTRSLHNLVANDNRYLFGREILREISKLIENGEEYKMTRHQRNVFQRHVAYIERRILKQQKIIIMTVGCLAAYRLGKPGQNGGDDEAKCDVLPGIDVNSVLVDEAGVLTLTSTLSLEHLKPSTMVLIGDHQQLQPLVLSSSALEAGLNRSIMEILVQDRSDVKIPFTMLTDQFRAHSDLRRFTSFLSYGDKLTDAPVTESHNGILKQEFFDAFPHFRTSRIWVVDHDGKETEVSSSYSNYTEASFISTLVGQYLEGNFMKSNDLVVLTPYDAQKALISNCLVAAGYAEVPCKTVDEYQGNEATCVIVSFTRSNSDHKLGFLMNANRVNVNISRAREMMVLCLNLSMLEPWKGSKSHIGRLDNFIQSNTTITKIDAKDYEVMVTNVSN